MEAKSVNEMKAVVDGLPRALSRGFKVYVCEQLGWSVSQWESRYYGRTRATAAEILSMELLAKRYQRMARNEGNNN